MPKPDDVTKPCVLVIDDEISIREGTKDLLEGEGFAVTTVGYLNDALAAIEDANYDAFVVDLVLPEGKSGIDFLQAAFESHPRAPFAIVSGYLDENWGSKLSNFLISRGRPFDAQIEKPGYEDQLREWAKALHLFLRNKEAARATAYHSEDIRVRKLVDNVVPIVASSELPVLLLGESGTGKEDLARLIHKSSDNPFKNGPFVAVNCAAISDELILSDLFGHVMGAFTGAYENRLGWFLEASGWQHETPSVQRAKRETVEIILERFGLSKIDDFYLRALGDDFKNLKRELDESLTEINKLVRKLKELTPYIAWLKQCGNNVGYARKALSKGASVFQLMGSKYVESDEASAEYCYIKNANPGTLFLDEIGDLSPAAEVALLRALDGYGIRPLGYTGPALLPNCRVIAATNRIRSQEDLREPYEGYSDRERMRKDLFWRIAGWILELPALRDRKLPDGRQEWCNSFKKWAADDGFHVDDEALVAFGNKLATRKEVKLWEGNWRELRHVYVRARSFAGIKPGNKIIGIDDLLHASEWVLIEESQSKDEKSYRDQVNSSRKADGASLNAEVEERLDSILILHHIIDLCDIKNCNDDELKRCIANTDISGLELCEAVAKTLEKPEIVFNAVKRCKMQGRVINPAVDILMGKKSEAALKNWWKKNADEVVGVVSVRWQKYSAIVPDLMLMSKEHLREPLARLQG